jgi:hypothetical protein
MNNNTRMTGKLTQLTNADASAQKENTKKRKHLRGDIRENKTKKRAPGVTPSVSA